jgi:S-(hydroxymethyl)glutathione dehydrogenase/alcohol dehydrogenase
LSVAAARAGGRIVWLGKTGVDEEVAFRWGSLMGERQIRRSSYGGARPHRDFPEMAAAYLAGDLKLDPLISRRIRLDEINDAFDALRLGEVVRTVIQFDT